jgi:hypothetical protein
MGKINFGNAGFFQRSAHTRAEFGREATHEGVNAVLQKLSKSASLARGRVCYLHGKGGKQKEVYVSLERKQGLKVVFYRTVLPKYLRVLHFVIASYEGLIRIDDLSLLPSVFVQLMELSSVGVYCVSASMEAEVIRLARDSKPRQDDLGVKRDPAYAIYIVDSDSSESPTGMIEIISYGNETPSDMIPISDPIVE